jgi:hypothetical protein
VDLAYAGQLAQDMECELGVAVEILGHDVEKKIVLAADDVAGDDLRPPQHRLLEGAMGGGVVALYGDADEDGDAEAEAAPIQYGLIAADRALRLQPLHAPPAGRGREPDLFGQFMVRQAAILLQGGEDLQVVVVWSVMTSRTLNRLYTGIFYRVSPDYWDNKERIFPIGVCIVSLPLFSIRA